MGDGTPMQTTTKFIQQIVEIILIKSNKSESILKWF